MTTPLHDLSAVKAPHVARSKWSDPGSRFCSPSTKSSHKSMATFLANKLQIHWICYFCFLWRNSLEITFKLHLSNHLSGSGHNYCSLEARDGAPERLSRCIRKPASLVGASLAGAFPPSQLLRDANCKTLQQRHFMEELGAFFDIVCFFI